MYSYISCNIFNIILQLKYYTNNIFLFYENSQKLRTYLRDIVNKKLIMYNLNNYFSLSYI